MAAGNSLQPVLQGDPLKPRAVDLATLAEAIGHTFARPELAAEALTHRSALDGQPDLKASFPNGNERLEFLGDRVLSLAMADLLLRRFPSEREGHLSRRHAQLVSGRILAEIAEEIGLAMHIAVPAGAPRPTAAILADTVEALLGAAFLDGGYAPALRMVEGLWGSRLATHHPAPRPPKMQLQEWAQARGLDLPVYSEIGREGMEHAPLFIMEVRVGNLPGTQGRGSTKRDAETDAAAQMLQRLTKP